MEYREMKRIARILVRSTRSVQYNNTLKEKRLIKKHLWGDILFNYGPGTQYPRVSGASSLFTGNLAYSIWRGAQVEGEVDD